MRNFFKFFLITMILMLTCGVFYLYISESIISIKSEAALYSNSSKQVLSQPEMYENKIRTPIIIGRGTTAKENDFTYIADISPKQEFWRVIESDENYNHQLQYYCKENVTIDDGKIVITSLKETKGDRNYTSGKVESNRVYLYGSFSFVIRVAKGRGLFPAIWMLPADFEGYPEIDIFEMIGNEPETFYGVIHYLDEGKKSREYFELKVESKEYYKIKLEWSENKLVWYIDDANVFETEKGVPNEPMYLIINQAIGGDWPGDPDKSTYFPAKFIIESISIEPEWSEAR